uniref:MFS domain-containing protein n=1 Tax=Bursaphelenchus xylophilus TaxID=6326 RepID=A0A1I7RNS3_BURXY
MGAQLQRVLVFTLTFIAYAFYHASRKNLSGVKKSVQNEWLANDTHEPFFDDETRAKTFLGTLDALFMLCYSGGLVLWGGIGDRWNPLYITVLGMVGSGVFLTLFGALPAYTHWFSVIYYIIIYALFGLVQGAGWPNAVTIMANWFKTNRGFVMGLWAACQPVGNIMGALIVSLVLPWGYEMTFVVNSILIVAFGIVLLFTVKPKPPVELEESSAQLDVPAEEVSHEPISMWHALGLPNVLPYCLCNACLKFVNYAFFFWLPLYLSSAFHWDESVANQLAAWYDFGGIVGSVLGGIISDRLGHRSPVITTMLIASIGLLFGYSDAGPNKLVNILLMTLLGVTISGPYNLIVGTIAVDLGSQPALAGNPKAMSTVTGLVDACGSLGSAVGQLFVPLVQDGLGWAYVFYLFILMNALSVLCLIRRCVLDVYELFQTRHRHRSVLVDEVSAPRTA